VKQVLFDLGTEDPIAEIELTHFLVFQILYFQLGHCRLFFKPFPPRYREGLMSR
jgi:hypothetical protein